MEWVSQAGRRLRLKRHRQAIWVAWLRVILAYGERKRGKISNPRRPMKRTWIVERIEGTF